MATYVNDLRLKEIATGDESGTWGSSTNTNLELIGEALSFGTEAITTNADTHTTTVADGASDPGRAMYLKYTGTLDSACTITIGPNTISRMQFIENGTSGSQNIIISQGSGANITIPPGDTKAVYLDGAGSGAAVVDAFASLSTVDLKVQDDLTVTGDIDVDGTTNLDVVDIDGALTQDGGAVFNEGAANVDFRIESDSDANMFFVDGSADTVGIGTGTPGDLLHVTNGDRAVDTRIRLDAFGQLPMFNVQFAAGTSSSPTAATSGTELLRIASTPFDGSDYSQSAVNLRVVAEADFSSNSTPAHLAFDTNSTTRLATEKMRLDKDGNLAIGHTSAASTLHVDKSFSGTLVTFHQTAGASSSDRGLDVETSSTGTTVQRWLNAGSELARVVGNGKFGIGTTSPSTLLEVNGGIRLSGLNGGDGLKFDLAGSSDFVIKESSTNDVVGIGALQHNISSNALGVGAAPDVALEVVTSDPRLRLRDNTAGGGSGNGGKIEFAGFHAGSGDGTRLFAEIHGLKNNSTGGDTHGDLKFLVNTGSASPSEVGRFNLDGVLCVGGTTPSSGDLDSTKSLYLEGAEATMVIKNTTATDPSQRSCIGFLDNGGTRRGVISCSNASTSYTTTSDYRLKEVLEPLPDGLNRLKQLKPVKFKWIDSGHIQEGFIAHEAQEVFADAVTGVKDAKDMQNMDYGRITPLLVKAIQEQQEQIEQLKTEIQTLQ